MECLNVPEGVLAQLKKLMSISLCANTVGQLMVAAMMSPPQVRIPDSLLCNLAFM
jgi:aspartate/methionine/tyrosine aminotransferase